MEGCVVKSPLTKHWLFIFNLLWVILAAFGQFFQSLFQMHPGKSQWQFVLYKAENFPLAWTPKINNLGKRISEACCHVLLKYPSRITEMFFFLLLLFSTPRGEKGTSVWNYSVSSHGNKQYFLFTVPHFQKWIRDCCPFKLQAVSALGTCVIKTIAEDCVCVEKSPPI